MKESGGYIINRCVDSLLLNSDRDFKHIISSGKAFQYVAVIREKADSERTEYTFKFVF